MFSMNAIKFIIHWHQEVLQIIARVEYLCFFWVNYIKQYTLIPLWTLSKQVLFRSSLLQLQVLHFCSSHMLSELLIQ